MSEPLPSAALDQLFRQARTYNGYQDKPVSEAQLRDIWDLMKMGPTSANALPARMVWCTTDDAKQKLAATVSEGNAAKVRSAPVSVVIGMDVEFFEHLPDLFPHADARSWFVGNGPTLADIALYGYTHVAEAGGFRLGDYPHVGAWLNRVAGLPGYVAMDVVS